MGVAPDLQQKYVSVAPDLQQNYRSVAPDFKQNRYLCIIKMYAICLNVR